MARPLRIEFPGGVYHVTARGNDREPIFGDDDDHERFLATLASAVARYRVLCHAYCLMGNHYHLLLETPNANLSRFMRQLNGLYAQRFNQRRGRTGHLLEGRFRARIVDRDPYLRQVCRYIVLNPVRAGLVTHPAQWRWSSYRATAGGAPVPEFLTVDWVLALGAATARGEAQRRYREFVEAGLRDSTDPSGRGLIAGDEGFLTRLRDRLQSASAVLEVPRAQRFAARPPLASLFAAVGSRADRNARCALAVRSHGYTMREVAGFLGVHYVTVSRALAGAGGGPRSLRCRIARPDP